MRTRFAFCVAYGVLWGGCLAEGQQADVGTLISVPGATFTMGSSESCSDTSELCPGDRVPHQVKLDDFEILDRFVTRSAYAACVAAKSCPAVEGLDATRYRIDSAESPMLINDPALA